MGRKIIYGILGAIFGFIGGAITLFTAYPLNRNLSGPDYTFAFLLTIFAIFGSLLGIDFAQFVNNRYGYKPLNQDRKASRISQLYYILYTAQPTVLLPIAVVVVFVMGGKLPALVVIMNIFATIGFLFHYRTFKTQTSGLPYESMAARPQFLKLLQMQLYVIPITKTIIVITYLIGTFW